MGPHPEGPPVDVQKYIGSCLFTQQSRTKRKSNNHSGRERGGFRGGPNNNCNRCVPGGGYGMGGNYAWTGVPLISVARRGKVGPDKVRHQRAIKPPPDGYAECPPDPIEEILPIAKLAIHAQGAPFFLSHHKDGQDVASSPESPYYGPFKSQNFFVDRNMYMFMSSRNPDDVSYYPNGCYVEEDPSPVHYVGGSPSRTVSSSPSQSDCISTTSEDSIASENGGLLPRIIKPRKRRKKDRRNSESDGASSCGSVHDESLGPIVTLQPYQPLCWSGSGGFKVFHHPPSPPLSPKSASPSWKTGAYPYPPSSRCQCPYCDTPSTFLTPPDSPVELYDNSGLLMTRVGQRRRSGRYSRSLDNRSNDSYDGFSDMQITAVDKNSARGINPFVLTSSHPPQRPWVYMTEQEPHASCVFTVMCYNILCDKYATRQMYGYCPNWALDWNYRKKYILQEILHYKADIISLQEVETEQFFKYFLPELQKEGYGGIFSPKSRAKTMSESERKHVDGCAIFYRSDKFLLLREHLMEFNQLAMANAEGCDDMLNRVMTKDNIGLAALLQTKENAYQPGADPSRMGQALLVCTAHIHWDPEYSDVKLIQTAMLMHELKGFVDDILMHRPNDPNLIPLLLCGDFNSLPESGVIEYLSSGRVSSRHCDFKDYVYKDCLSKFGNSSKTNELTHPFQISRAYNDGIMPFTNYSYDFKGVIDYVFYSKLHMTVLGVLGPVDPQWLESNRVQGCPHPHVPSDHFPIVVELLLQPTLPLQRLTSLQNNGLQR